MVEYLSATIPWRFQFLEVYMVSSLRAALVNAGAAIAEALEQLPPETVATEDPVAVEEGKPDEGGDTRPADTEAAAEPEQPVASEEMAAQEGEKSQGEDSATDKSVDNPASD